MPGEINKLIKTKPMKGTDGIMRANIRRERINSVEVIKTARKLPHLMMEGRCSLPLPRFLDLLKAPIQI
jgi:hypothetical protein